MLQIHVSGQYGLHLADQVSGRAAWWPPSPLYSVALLSPALRIADRAIVLDAIGGQPQAARINDQATGVADALAMRLRALSRSLAASSHDAGVRHAYDSPQRSALHCVAPMAAQALSRICFQSLAHQVASRPQVDLALSTMKLACQGPGESIWQRRRLRLRGPLCSPRLTWPATAPRQLHDVFFALP